MRTMIRSMTRWALAGSMALAALSAVAVLGVGSAAAEAAPSVSVLAETYVGADPRGYVSQWAVAISDGGRITGTRSSAFSRDKISGQVSADGSYSMTVTATIWAIVRRHGHSGSEANIELRTVRYQSYGNLASDADGNLVGTGDRGESFVWLRQ